MGRYLLLSIWIVTLPAIAYGQSISAVWDSNPPGDQITVYEVCISTTPLSCNVQRASVPASETSYAFTPTPGVLYRVAVRAVNAGGAGVYAPEVTASIPLLTQPANQTSTLNVPITPLAVSATDPDGSPLQFTHSGLPFGLSLNANTGVISGTPTSAGVFNVTVFVSDNLETSSRTFVWTVQGAGGSDTTAPSLAISSHTTGQTVATSSITLSGTASDSGTGGSGIASVTVNGAAATGGTASGNNTASWSRSITLSAGANTISVVARDGAGNARTSTITLTLSAPTSSVVSAVSATPSSGSGTTQTFALQYSDTQGATRLSNAWVWFNATLASTSGNSCLLYYNRPTATVYLLNDAGNVWMPGTPGSNVVLQNSQCAVGLGGSNATVSGNTLTLNLAMTFKPAYAGAKNVYMFAANDANVNSGWQTRGTWSVTSSGTAPTTTTITADLVTPNTGSGATQAFALQYASTRGATDLSTVWAWFNATFGSNSSNSCMLYYNRSTAMLYLLNDAASLWMPGTPGSSVTLQNSQCAVDLRSSSGTVSGNTLTLNLAMTFKSAYAGAKNVYMYAANAANVNSGWQDRGDWTVTSTGSTTGSPTAPTVTADSATPSSGTGSTQVFSLQYSSSRGATDLLQAWVWFNAAFTGDSTNSCMLYYDRSTGTLRMLNDGSTWMSASLGSSGTLGNSQCAVDLGSSSVTLNGNTLTLNLAMTFRSQYRGAKNIYMYAANVSGVNSGWRQRGIWTVP